MAFAMQMCLLAAVAFMAVHFTEGAVIEPRCGNGQPRSYIREGIRIQTSSSMERNVRVCTLTLSLQSRSSRVFMVVDVKNTTRQGLACDSSTKLAIQEDSPYSYPDEICGPMHYYDAFTKPWIIRVRGDTGNGIPGVEINLSTRALNCPVHRYDMHEEESMDGVIARGTSDYECQTVFRSSLAETLRVMVWRVDLKPNGASCQKNKVQIFEGHPPNGRKVFDSCDATDHVLNINGNAGYMKVQVNSAARRSLRFDVAVSPRGAAVDENGSNSRDGQGFDGGDHSINNDDGGDGGDRRGGGGRWSGSRGGNGGNGGAGSSESSASSEESNDSDGGWLW